MDVKSLIAQLKAEVVELQSTIKVLEGRAGKGPRLATTTGIVKPHGRRWSEADKRRMSLAVKRGLAKRKASKG